jgi:hypothetical protein
VEINEFYLFHGTSLKTVEIICKDGFDERMGSFALQWDHPTVLKSHTNMNDDRPRIQPHLVDLDSIFAEHGIANGGQQHHNEYVVFDRHQVYPEYIVRYTV